LGQYDKAIEDFNAALNVNNKNAGAWAMRGLAYEKAGKRAEARESYQRALSVDANSAAARDGLRRV
jgi:Flp pilus assembly protein TadD